MSTLKQERLVLSLALLGSLLGVPLSAQAGQFTLTSTPFNIGSNVTITTSAGVSGWHYMLMYDEQSGDNYIGGEWLGLGLSPAFRIVNSATIPSNGTIDCSVYLPNDPSLVGRQCFFQSMEVSPTWDEIHTSNRLDVTVESGGGGSYQSQVSSYGITWTFGGSYEVGQFANGDWWVVGPVRIIAIDPPSVSSGGRIMNGSMVNPPTEDYQGYDSAMYTYPNGYSPDYDPKLNVAYGVSSQSPLVLQAGSSLVSTRSIEDLYNKNCLQTAAVLTVLSSPAAAGSFRPPYCGTDKTIRYNKSQLSYSMFKKLAPVSGTPQLSTVVDQFARVWLDHIPGWRGEEYSHPVDNFPNYGREISTRMGIGALMLNLDFTDSQKEPLLISMCQIGIDNYGVIMADGRDNWPGYGGMESGRFFPILVAGIILNDTSLKSIGEKTLPNGGDYHFGEIDQTFYVRETSPGVYNEGYGGYGPSDVGVPEWGIRHWWQIQEDNKDWGAAYRECCTANSWSGYILASRMMGIKSLWHHDAIFDYLDRYIPKEPKGDSRRVWDRPFTESMWDTYRSKF